MTHGSSCAEGLEAEPLLPFKPHGLSDDAGSAQLQPEGRPPTPWQGVTGAPWPHPGLCAQVPILAGHPKGTAPEACGTQECGWAARV